MRISPISLNGNYRQRFKANYSKENNVAILGSSKTTYELVPALIQCTRISRAIVSADKNVITGCGNRGIMGETYYTVAGFSKRNKENKPEQNLVILREPLWGDEDLEECVVIDKAKSEAERIEKFIENANYFVIFPGGAGTIQEASTLISNNYYNKANRKQVVLVGSEFFKNLDQQFKTMQKMGLINCNLSELYTITDDVDEVIRLVNC